MSNDEAIYLVGVPKVFYLGIAVLIGRAWRISKAIVPLQMVMVVMTIAQMWCIHLHTKGWWFTFDIFGALINVLMADRLYRNCRGGWGEFMAVLYAVLTLVFLLEYSYADPSTEAIANTIYYWRIWGFHAADYLLAALLYLDLIGTSDKGASKWQQSETSFRSQQLMKTAKLPSLLFSATTAIRI